LPRADITRHAGARSGDDSIRCAARDTAERQVARDHRREDMRTGESVGCFGGKRNDYYEMTRSRADLCRMHRHDGSFAGAIATFSLADPAGLQDLYSLAPAATRERVGGALTK